MFKSVIEFANALAEGRRFKTPSGTTIFYKKELNNPFSNQIEKYGFDMNKLMNILFPTIIGLLFVVILHLFASIFRVNLGDCNKTYNIDTVLYSKLFCEVKKSD